MNKAKVFNSIGNLEPIVDDSWIITSEEYKKYHFIDTTESPGSAKEMVFGLDDDMGRYVGEPRNIKPIKRNKFIKQLKRMVEKDPAAFLEKPFKKYAYLTSKIKSGTVAALDQYLMLLDVDFSEGMEHVVAKLKKDNISFIVVKSSSDRYWIICDKMGTVTDLCGYMTSIPFVDANYIDCSYKQGVLLYRAFPKKGFIPQIGDIDHIKASSHFNKWVKKFKEHWESKEIAEIANILILEAL